QALRDKDALVRRHAAWALGEIRTAEALNALRERLTEEADPGVRGEIEEALGDRHQAAGGAQN
ncbi:MAG: HEAT repeat domain-containing protein, partial [Deltaproteobacteria bacterium]|nr:HEAT repeat domain-containing protein [Deltaproteobacteria bacterium]